MMTRKTVRTLPKAMERAVPKATALNTPERSAQFLSDPKQNADSEVGWQGWEPLWSETAGGEAPMPGEKGPRWLSHSMGYLATGASAIQYSTKKCVMTQNHRIRRKIISSEHKSKVSTLPARIGRKSPLLMRQHLTL